MFNKDPSRQWLPKTAPLAITLALTLGYSLGASAADNNQLPAVAKLSQGKNIPVTPGKTEADTPKSLTALTQSNASYSYDELGRLSRITVNGKLITEYQYDAVGNRTQKQHHQ
ncbi:RHS repeat protein [Thalassomonas viridans]|uniref:RHS repeat protein n=1 Tax=Thalassomonas viridans TaxID=137584 RepID=A0AAE9ZA44_9GAMM|nr:RHS repeat domain-containing protein [Thalassomonas viridans]WDE08765.1 RHS repeat protein [Thalassomonas viridans]